MKPPSTIVGHHVFRAGEPVAVLCIDCLDVTMEPGLRIGQAVHSWQPRSHCTECGSQMSGPVHLDPGHGSWGPDIGPTTKGDN